MRLVDMLSTRTRKWLIANQQYPPAAPSPESMQNQMRAIRCQGYFAVEQPPAAIHFMLAELQRQIDELKEQARDPR